MNADEKRPGEQGYAAHWRKRLGQAGIGSLKGQGKSNRKIGGRSLLLVLKTYGEAMNNTSGECWPSQEYLAQQSGTSVSTVKRAQEWAIENGWLEVLAPPIPRVRGCRVLLLPGQLPVSNSLSVDGATPCQQNTNSLSVGHELPVRADRQTLSKNSHLELSLKRLPDKDWREDPDDEDDGTEGSEGEERSAKRFNPLTTPLDQLPPGIGYSEPVQSNLSEWKQRDLLKRQMAEEGLNEYGEPFGTGY